MYKPIYLLPLVISIHGIRTKAIWQSNFSAIMGRYNILCCPYRYGYFSLLRFLWRPSRDKMIDLFYEFYSRVVEKYGEGIDLDNEMKRPSIVAHSFGSYILGYCMLKYPDVKFDKVILCGSILPENFDWDTIVFRDQISFLRNEYGVYDYWAKIVGFIVPNTGMSGVKGFHVATTHISEERYDYFKHSDYFKGQHIDKYWVPFMTNSPSCFYVRHGHDFVDFMEFKNTLDITGTVIDSDCFGAHPNYKDVELSENLVLDWIKINPDIYTFLFDHKDESVKGYINAMPIDEGAFQKLKMGVMSDNEVIPENIIPFVGDQDLSIYLMSIAILPSARLVSQGILHSALEKLTNGFVNKMINYYKTHNIRIKRILAVGWTSEGRKLCQLLGMHRVGTDKFDNPIYFLEFNDLSCSGGIKRIRSMDKLVNIYYGKIEKADL
jgi:pimeloyl-ACP methyl ester carboxylesterase